MHCLRKVVTVSEKGETQAFKLTVDEDYLFNIIKRDSRSRIQDTEISADALLPEGPYNLWREGETSRRAKDLVGAFAQFPHLPKMLNQKAIFDTLISGCRDGTFLLRITRPDRSERTYWRETPDQAALNDPGLEVVLPEAGSLTDLSPALLVPGELPELWTSTEITVGNLYEYFSGNNVVKIVREGYEEPAAIPKAEPEVVNTSVHQAVLDGKLWMTSGPVSVFAEEIPPGILSDDARLQAPPPPMPPTDLLRENLPEAWEEDTVSALNLSLLLSKKAGRTLPWAIIREAIDGALRTRLLELAADSGPWPCEYTDAKSVKLCIPSQPSGGGPTPPPLPPSGVRVAEGDLGVAELQSLYETIGDIKNAAVGHDLKFRLRIQLGGGDTPPPDELVTRINELLQEVSENLRLG